MISLFAGIYGAPNKQYCFLALLGWCDLLFTVYPCVKFVLNNCKSKTCLYPILHSIEWM